MAQSILAAAGPSQVLSHTWIDRFFRRHLEAKTKPRSKLERARVRRSTREAFDAFYDLLERLVEKRGIKVYNIANMDEYGLQEGESGTGKVIGTSLTNKGVRDYLRYYDLGLSY
jgi:4-hydroxybenzoate polyprenyltransferase